MIEVTGKYGTAKIFTDLVDDKSIAQVKALMDMPFTEGQTIRMMPDIHAGAGCTIGTTMTITDKVCPNLVGVDIGCGMLAAKLKNKKLDLPEIDRVIREYVPSGMNVHDTVEPGIGGYLQLLCHLRCKEDAHINISYAFQSYGTLGGGNHFIEIDKSEKDGAYWLVIHSGSRHLGLEVANYYQKKAIHQQKFIDKDFEKVMIKSIVEVLKEQGRQSEIKEIVGKMKKSMRINADIPDDLCWLEGQLFDDYMYDMGIVQWFASENRMKMARTIVDQADLQAVEMFETVHNYINTVDKILRKGAVGAFDGIKLIIPMNMRDGSLICIGKGNPDWNQSAPHGAGRIMSRAQAKKDISEEAFKEAMHGIYTTTANESTIDEAPMAYKPMDSIVSNIGDTVDIMEVIKPVYNFKASE